MTTPKPAPTMLATKLPARLQPKGLERSLPSKDEILDYVDRRDGIRRANERIGRARVALWIDLQETMLDQMVSRRAGGPRTQVAGDGANNLERMQYIVGMDMLRHSDPDQFLTLLEAKKLRRTSKKGNQLWETMKFGNNYYSNWSHSGAPTPQHWLRYMCPSTGEIYVSGVPYIQGQTPDAAMSWKMGLTLEEYLSIEQET